MAEGRDEPPHPPPHSLPASLSYHQLLFGFLGVIKSLREEGYYKPFMLTHTGYTADAACAHMGVCTSVWQEGERPLLFYFSLLNVFSA